MTMPSRARGWRECGCYVWRTRKPHAVLGLPLIGRHTAYVGETGSRYFRDQQHRFGDARYGASGKSWSDLGPKVYPLPCFLPHVKWCREVQEKIWIKLLMPVYNTEWNGGNPRRIKPIKAQQQRWARDKIRQSTAGLIKINVLPAMARGVLMLLVLTGLIYSGWGAWVS
jgi:hypothetical protein